MKKDIEWLKEEVRKLRTVTISPFISGSVNINSVLRLIDQLEEPEITEEQAWDLIYDKHGSKQHTALYKIYLEQNGYTVEKKEKKYYVLDSEDIPLLERANNQACKTTTALSIYEDGRDNSRFALTEQEIEDYDDRFWQFAVPVEEVGE